MFRRCWFSAIFFFVIATLVLAGQNRPVYTDQEQPIITELKGLRSVPDKDRGNATQRIALQIRQLPAQGNKLGLANALASLSTEGDFGHDTLQEVATTLAGALEEASPQSNEEYSELAQFIRYENVNVTLQSPQLSAEIEKLENEDRDRSAANFTLSDLHGKPWTLKDLSGHVVLVNFWATWCPPCRKEMPDLDSLYKRFENQGLIVLAISDEDSGKVTTFLAQHSVSYPVLLDPGRKVNELFHVEGIPKSFIYNRQGSLAAQAIDMRTKDQFLKLLSKAGLTE